jgi:hypothetical protein
MRYQLLRGLIAGVILTVLPGVVFAQSSEGLQITPAVIEDGARPGQDYSFNLKVTNLGETEKTLSISAQDIKGLDDQGKPIFTNEGEKTEYELSTWITLSQKSITLKPKEVRSVPLTVHVPLSATPGAHFGGVFFEVGASQLDENGAAIGYRVGTVISLKIAGDVVEDAQLREFATDKLVYSIPEVLFSIKVANRSNVLVRPHGIIDVSDMFGNKLGSITVNDEGAPVFPGSERSYTSPWAYDGFAFGRYQAVASLVYGEDGRKTISGATSFWVLPLKPILLVGGVLLAAVLGLFFAVRSYVRRTLRAMGASSTRAVDHVASRRERAASRLMMLSLSLFVFALLFLAVLFVIFA